MKISKLKFVFAFVLLCAMLAVGTNVQAARPVNGQIQVSTIVQSLSAIVDGDQPGAVPTKTSVVSVSNTAANVEYGGVTMNPVQSYNLVDKVSGNTTKAYILNPGKLVKDEPGFEFQGAYNNDDIGIALRFGERNPNGNVANVLATQAYIWLVQNGFNGENALVSSLNAAVPGVQYAYTTIKDGVAQAKSKPTYAYYTQEEARTVPVEMRWNEAAQEYQYVAEDGNHLDEMALVDIFADEAQGIRYNKVGGNLVFTTTEQVGSASNPVVIAIRKSIDSGRYGVGQATDEDGNTFVYSSGAQKNTDVYYIALYTNALRVRVHKILNASATNSKTGDATVEGARYGVYKDRNCTKLVEEIVTDADGYAVTQPLEFADYYVNEISASEGCKIDETVYTAAKNAAQNVDGKKVVTVESSEDVIYGGFRMIVSNSDESGDTTKFPSINSKIRVQLDSDKSQVYEDVVSAEGYVEFTELPYGHYTVTEIERPDVPEHDRLDYMDPIQLFVDREQTYIYSKIVNTEVAQRYVKISKLDSESKQMITKSPAVYRITDDAGNEIVQRVMYPHETVLDRYSTENFGYLYMPAKLPAGTYKVYEVTAPEGYYNESLVTGRPSTTFTVETNSPDDYDTTKIVEVPQEDVAQKGILTVVTTGSKLNGTNATNKQGQDISSPEYMTGPIAGVKYQVIANEDIVTGDMKVHYKAGQVVDTFTSNDAGEFTTKLYIGSYTLKMVECPKGYVFDKEDRLINVEYQGQTVKEFNLPKQRYVLTRQRYSLELDKVLEGLNFYKQNEAEQPELLNAAAYGDILVGIYAAENINDVNGNMKIEKDTLVDVVTFNDKGVGRFLADYPMGKFYAKEIKTNIQYELNVNKYPFETKPENNENEVFNIDCGEIVNKALKDTKYKLTKIEDLVAGPDSGSHSAFDTVTEWITDLLNALAGEPEDAMKDVLKLPDAEVQLFYVETDGKKYPLLEKVGEEFVEVVRTTDENGEINLEGLPYGKYVVKELTAPRYYYINKSELPFELTPDKKVVEQTLMDERILVAFDITVVDETEEVVAGAKVELVDPDTKEVAYSAVVDEETGVAHFENVRAGRYIRQVTDLEKWYVTPATKEMYLEEDADLIETVKVKYVRGNILINKTDDETGEAVPGAKFQVVDADGVVVAEETTDDNGQLLITGLLYGEYTVVEVEAPEGYEKSDLEVKVEVVVDGQTYPVDFTNVPTGDIAVALYAMIALISVGAIVVATKKVVRN